MLSLLPLLAGWIWYRSRKQGQRPGLQVVIAFLAVVVVVAPWFVRNYRIFHQFVPFRQQFWLAMHVGNNGDTSHWDPATAHPSTNAMEEEEYNRLGELNYMAEKRREVVTFISAHPGGYAWVAFRRFLFAWTGFWSLSPKYLAMEPSDPRNILMNIILLVPTIAGLRRMFRERSPDAFLLASSLLAYPLIYYLSFMQRLYLHPIDPLIVILATYGAIGLFSNGKKKKLVTGGQTQPA